MDANINVDPAFLLLMGVIAATIWFVVAARRHQAPAALITVGAIDLFCGGLIAALGVAHLAAVAGAALTRPTFVYDFRLYSLVLLGLLLIVGGLVCLLHAWKLTCGDSRAWKITLWASVVLLAINLPLTPIQGFAVGFSVLALVNLIALIGTRSRFH